MGAGFVKTALAIFFYALVFLFFPLTLSAQPGIAEFYNAGNEVQRWYFSFADLVLVLAAIAGMLGGLRVYANWQSGSRHIDAQVMGWFFSCLFLLLVGTFLSALFGVH
ncbi:DUF4134 family protein [Pedobacter sp. GR22-6]|uniref:DUF4134 family protein n=1 Tax=Pedobacter sp. GR22-6 TaxID=3127957 RepID=UPI00307D7BDC